jgi:hypothetical protein
VTAGYSGTPLVRKIGIKENCTLVLVGAPAGWTMGELPAGVRVSRERRTGKATGADIVVAFFGDLATLSREVPRLSRTIVPDGALWVAWPRRAAGRASDITDNSIRAVALPLGLVDVKVAAVDDTWSGLKLVWRKELRPGLV